VALAPSFETSNAGVKSGQIYLWKPPGKEVKRMKTQRKVYSEPTVTVYGDVERITQSHRTGTVVDRTFPAGTPISVILMNLS
jgi:hypothetical protein